MYQSLRVRRMLHSMGFRFRIHRKNIPGTPDIVLPKYRLCIFVHGCFWHQHTVCKRATIPKTRPEFWKSKFRQTKKRDEKVEKELKKTGWTVCTIWECETKITEKLTLAITGCFQV